MGNIPKKAVSVLPGTETGAKTGEAGQATDNVPKHGEEGGAATMGNVPKHGEEGGAAATGNVPKHGAEGGGKTMEAMSAEGTGNVPKRETASSVESRWQRTRGEDGGELPRESKAD